ncbi:MAG: hypothetical protein R3D62_02315 [Xanthobacteraceae bacterium]
MGPIDRLATSQPATRVLPVAAGATTADDRERPPGRSLIPLAPKSRLPRSPRPVGTGSAAFLAHLIATSQKLPQTRDRRRTDPAEARAAYGATRQAGVGKMTGRVLTHIA